MAKYNAFVFLLIIGAFSVLTYLATTNNNYEINCIKHDIQIGDAYVNFVRDVPEKGSNDWQVEYDFKINEKTITGRRYFRKDDYNRDQFICKHFPIVYSSKHTDMNDILIDRQDSIKYGILSK